MKKFTIWINQYNMGVFEGTDEKNALDQYARDAGYRDWAEIEDDDDQIDVFERDGARSSVLVVLRSAGVAPKQPSGKK